MVEGKWRAWEWLAGMPPMVFSQEGPAAVALAMGLVAGWMLARWQTAKEVESSSLLQNGPGRLLAQ